MTYLWHLGFISLILVLIASLIINQFCLRGSMVDSNWLILFMSPFVPVCFSAKNGSKLAKIQYKTFFHQTWTTVLIYGSTIVIILCLVNQSAINYEEDLILNNQTFNAYGGSILLMGLISFVLSFR